MTTNPEPTALYAVVVGKRDGETLIAVRADDDYTPWALIIEGRCEWHRWDTLCDELTDIRVVPVDEMAAKPKPGPWLTGDKLKAIISTLKEGDVVEAGFRGRKASGDLHPSGGEGLKMWSTVVRHVDGTPGLYVDVLRIIERAPEPEPEPGADIRFEVVDAAFNRLVAKDGDAWGLAQSDKRRLRAALAAADAKRAELEVES